MVGRFLAGSSFAHAINTVRIAHSFARLGQEVTIVCRRDPERDWDTAQLARHYGLEQPVRWVLKRHPWGRGWRRGRGALGVAGLVGEWIIHRPDLVYARDFTAPGWACRLGIPVVLESHAHPEADAWPAGFERAVGASHRAKFRTWITISTRLAERYRELGADPGKLLVLPGGVDLRQFARPDALPASPYPSTTRQPVAPSSIATPLGNSGRVAGRVVYAGHLYDYKGIPTVLAAATALPDVSFELVGGWPQDVERHREAAKSRGINNVTFHGLLPQAQLPPYLWHADALLLPPSATHPSAQWTSPVKMGEYLATRVPVVASGIPALRDWLDQSQVEFFAPDDAADLAAALRRVLTDPPRRAALTAAAWDRVQSLSYERRALQILQHAGFDSGIL